MTYGFDDFVDRLSLAMAGDGYRRAVEEIFLHDFDPEWRGWIAVSGNSYGLSPVVGVMSLPVRDIVYEVGRNIYRNPYANIEKHEYGPPLLHVGLHQLLDADPYYRKYISWSPATDGLSEKILGDLLLCLRERGYLFIEKNLDFGSILMNADKYGKFNHAQQFHLPVVLIMLNRDSEMKEYIARCLSQYPSPEHPLAIKYQEYIAALRGFMARKW
jgi:hypothetical protein